MAFTKDSCLIFLVIFFLLFFCCSVEGSRLTVSKVEDLKIEKQLKLLNKPYVKSFKSEHGDVFDCVDIYKQPALNHPLLQNHKVQVRPTFIPKSIHANHSSSQEFLSTTFKESCPEGTVLILRTQKEDLIRTQKVHPMDAIDGNFYAGLNTQGYYNYDGVQAAIDVYPVKNVLIDQASGAQIILTKGAQGGNDKDVKIIQFGWHVFPAVNNDTRVRLFTYWTNDNYESTGCYNQLCPGFVLTSNKWTPGMVIPDDMLQIKMKAFKDGQTHNWWLAVGEKEEVIGYWPNAIFNDGFTDAAEIQIVGIVYSPSDEPSPPMCNGFSPDFKHPNNLKACRFKQVRTKFTKGDFDDLDEFDTHIILNAPDYYDLRVYHYDGPVNGVSIGFGGPGGYKAGKK